MLASGTLLAGPAPVAVGVKGKVTGWEKLLPQTYAEAAERPPPLHVARAVADGEAGLPQAVGQRRRATSASSPSAPAPRRPTSPWSVKLTGGRLTPATIVLSPGSRLSFKNADPFPHVLYEVGNDKWAANPTAPGSTRDWAAHDAGAARHPRPALPERRHVRRRSIPNAVEFAMPDRDGAFAMAVPPGDYTLKAFFEGKQVGKPPTACTSAPGASS